MYSLSVCAARVCDDEFVMARDGSRVKTIPFRWSKTFTRPMLPVVPMHARVCVCVPP